MRFADSCKSGKVSTSVPSRSNATALISIGKFKRHAHRQGRKGRKGKPQTRENKFRDTASLRAEINHQSQVFFSEMVFCFCFSFASLASLAVQRFSSMVRILPSTIL